MTETTVRNCKYISESEKEKPTVEITTLLSSKVDELNLVDIIVDYKNEMEKETIEEKNIREFWEFIEDADWDSDDDYKRIQKLLYGKYSDNRKVFVDIYRSLTNDLYGRFINVDLNIGDDGFSDLLAQIVGNGKDFYDSIDDDGVQSMSCGREFTESFGYSFHTDDEEESED